MFKKPCLKVPHRYDKFGGKCVHGDEEMDFVGQVGHVGGAEEDVRAVMSPLIGWDGRMKTVPEGEAPHKFGIDEFRFACIFSVREGEQLVGVEIGPLS